MISWVLGRGLLGQSIELHLAQGTTSWTWPGGPLRWQEPIVLEDQLARAADDFATASHGGPWQVCWCAGAGVVGSDQHRLDEETAALASLLRGLGANRRRLADNGSLFVASSAGGVYAGAEAPPFTECSAVRPLSAYGRTKLAQEQLASAWAGQHAVRLLVGRIANLYGPGQNLRKPQGLISQLALSTLRRRPFVVYVGLDTTRDYLYAADAAGIVADGLQRLRSESEPGATVTKIIAAQAGTTVATVLAEVARVTRQPPRVVLATTPLSGLQVRDLRLRSRVWPELDARTLTTLAHGVHTVVADLRLRLAAGQFGGEP